MRKHTLLHHFANSEESLKIGDTMIPCRKWEICEIARKAPSTICSASSFRSALISEAATERNGTETDRTTNEVQFNAEARERGKWI